MNKRRVYNILLALGIVGGIYYFASKFYKKYKSLAKGLQDGQLLIEELQNEIVIVNQEGESVEEFSIPASNMPFPLQVDAGCYDGVPGGCEEYNNVQKLQTVLMHQISAVADDLIPDGKFGLATEQAVINYLNTFSPAELVPYGYDFSMASNYNFITESLYNDNILPQYVAIIA